MLGLILCHLDKVGEEVHWQGLGGRQSSIELRCSSDDVPCQVDGPLLNVGKRMQHGYPALLASTFAPLAFLTR